MAGTLAGRHPGRRCPFYMAVLAQPYADHPDHRAEWRPQPARRTR
ncbi:DUF6221 family protein [Jatrophihabitans sp. DSM 45814]